MFDFRDRVPVGCSLVEDSSQHRPFGLQREGSGRSLVFSIHGTVRKDLVTKGLLFGLQFKKLIS